MSVVRAWLAEIRAERRARWFALAAAVVVGLAAAQVHWYGLFLGGALVGLVSKTARRGLLAGVAFGILAWAAFAAQLGSHGALAAYLGMGRVFYLSAAIPVVAGAVGSLIRGVW